LPSPGRITGLRPASGPWTRDDSGAYEGCTIPRFYDTLISKLIVWGEDRDAAIARMARALDEYKITGVRTTIPVLSRIIAHPEFRAGRLSTQFLERILPELTPAGGRYEAIAIIAAVLAEHERLRGPATTDAAGTRSHDTPAAVPQSAWRTGLRPAWRAGSR
jgi:acetyl-CoA carboxylase biotin carboxylase subunit